MVKSYIPDKGDLVWLNFTPQSGHEQSGRRPAVVISPEEYNGKTGLGIFCPVSSKVKGYPFEVKIKNDLISGAVLSDHIKKLDWESRKAEFISKVTETELEEILEKIKALIQ
jgi:mRNA interferase MazF